MHAQEFSQAYATWAEPQIKTFVFGVLDKIKQEGFMRYAVCLSTCSSCKLHRRSAHLRATLACALAVCS